MSNKRRWRRVHIDGQEWRYSYINSIVEIRDPQNNKTLVSVNEFDSLKGWTPDLIERAHWKGNTLPAVSPGLVKHHIEKHILGRNVPDYVYVQKENWLEVQEQLRTNENHWVGKKFDNLQFSMKIAYKREHENDEWDVDKREVEIRENIRPLDIIQEVFDNTTKPIAILIFTLGSENNPNRDEQIHAFDRNDKQPGTYVIMSPGYGSGYPNQYGTTHSYIPKYKMKTQQKQR